MLNDFFLGKDFITFSVRDVKDGVAVVRIGVIACKTAMDNLCPGCAKCFKAINEQSGGFDSLEKPIEVAFLTSCGGCPGLITVKMDLVNRILDTLGQKVDVVYLGSCVQRAIENFNCPIDPGFVKDSLEKAGIKVVIGTQAYAPHRRSIP